MSFFDRFGRFTHIFCQFQWTHSIGSWFSFHEQVVHGDLALDIVGISSGLDTIGGNHRQVDGLLCTRLT